MFNKLDLPQNPLFKFIFPSVQPIAVVKRIIAALDEQHSQTIRLPFYTHFVPYLTHLPSFLQDFVQWVSDNFGILDEGSRSVFRLHTRIMPWSISLKFPVGAPMKARFLAGLRRIS